MLRGDGIGAAMFGGDPDSVIEYVRSLLGEPTGDTGWVDPFTFALCEGNEVRRVDWGVLSLLFGDQSNFGSGRRHFFAWEYGLAGQIGDPPQGLRTAGLVTLGSRVVDLRAEFPEVAINEAERRRLRQPAELLRERQLPRAVDRRERRRRHHGDVRRPRLRRVTCPRRVPSTGTRRSDGR